MQPSMMLVTINPEKGNSMKPTLSFLFIGIFSLLMINCRQQPSTQETELKRFPLNDMEGILTQSGVQIDRQISSDGSGSLRIDAAGPTVVHLFEVSDISVEDARLIYRARVRTEGLSGQTFLEMWCRFPGLGEFFSRGLDRPLTGTTDWTTRETPFFLKKGQKPDLVKLNLVVSGKGTVWIDDLRLLKGPLQ